MRPNPQSRSTSHEAGFTLLEAMVAVGILGFGLLTLAVMQLQAVSQGAAGRHTGDAAATGRSYIEQVHRIPWSELDTAVAAGTWTNPSWTGAASTVDVAMAQPAGGGASVEHSYDVQWRVTNVVVGGVTNPCLRDVEVRVTWDEEDRSTPKQLELITRRYNWGDSAC